MNPGFWPRTCLIAGLAVGVAAAASASPAKFPRRVVNNQTVDLSPLLRWWTNHFGMRPLTAWVHVTGNIVGTNSYGWVVQAQVEAHPRPGQEPDSAGTTVGGAKRILLRHPPLQDRAAFEQFASQLRVLEQERDHASGTEAQARSYLHPGSNGVHRVRFRHKGQGLARREAGAVEHSATTSKQELDKQISALKQKMASWPNTDHYEVDCFALDTGGVLNKLPLYDHGMTW